MFLLEVVVGKLEQDILCYWLEDHDWLSLAVTTLEAGQNLGKPSD
jgi:hypothetical protein